MSKIVLNIELGFINGESICSIGEDIIARYDLFGKYDKQGIVDKIQSTVFEQADAYHIARFAKSNKLFSLLKLAYDPKPLHHKLKERLIHPSGEFDNAGRWYPEFAGCLIISGLLHAPTPTLT